MTPKEFCYWLQGFFEINGQLKGDIKEALTPEQVTMIRDHLQYVFAHPPKAEPVPFKIPEPMFVPTDQPKEWYVPDPLSGLPLVTC